MCALRRESPLRLCWFRCARVRGPRTPATCSGAVVDASPCVALESPTRVRVSLKLMNNYVTNSRRGACSIRTSRICVLISMKGIPAASQKVDFNPLEVEIWERLYTGASVPVSQRAAFRLPGLTPTHADQSQRVLRLSDVRVRSCSKGATSQMFGPCTDFTKVDT